MHYLLRYYKERHTASETVLQKLVLELLFKILGKYTYKEFLKISF